MRILITGITGMTGSHLAEYLLAGSNVEVHGILRPRDSRDFLADVEKDLVLYECDLREKDAVASVVNEVKPDQIYHLAAETSVANSWENPDQTIINNITCQLNVFEAVRKYKMNTRILVTGSSEAYGLVSEHDLPVTEDTGFKPLSPYGVSKVGQDALAYQYHQSYGMDIVRVRVFNLTGPRQSSAFALSNFAKQIAWIKANKREPVLMVGNLDALRDFTDFRDVVKAYQLALELGASGEVYNIGSGKSRKLKDVLNLLLDISKTNVKIQQNPDRMRPSDIPHMVCDNTKFCFLTGWHPEIAFRETLRDLFRYWQAAVEGER
ncbi:MAG: GDP-mannose 4,6-dehydratase [Desulfobacula sp.]|jgi:GDP-4-dehydro-6-deoxy-D-mannose reductase|nr:GDP-mannose 4,6-dehydratase [Desulfobacula sp.]